MGRRGCLLAAVLLAALALAACKARRPVGETSRRTGPRAYTGDSSRARAQGEPTEAARCDCRGAEPPSLNYQLDPLDAWANRSTSFCSRVWLDPTRPPGSTATTGGALGGE